MNQLDKETKSTIRNIVGFSLTILAFIITGLLGWASESILSNKDKIDYNYSKIVSLEKRDKDFDIKLNSMLKVIDTKLPIEVYIKDLEYLQKTKELETRILEKKLLLLQKEVK